MGLIEQPPQVLFVLVAFSRYDEAFVWLREKAEELWGPIAFVSDEFLFQETDYYQNSMGPDLRKPFFVFETLIDPIDLIEIKRTTNELEELYKAESNHEEQRPLNLDPGYLNLGKFVLASTKDHAHRLYLGKGIFAEVTLHYSKKKWLAPRLDVPRLSTRRLSLVFRPLSRLL